VLKCLVLAALTITLPTGCSTLPRAMGPGLASPFTSFTAKTTAPEPSSQQAEGSATEGSVTIKADGPFPVRLADVPTAEYDPNNQYATGEEEDRPESPITEEEADRLRAEALLLPPSPNVQGVTALAPGQLAPLPAGVSFDSLDANDCCGGGLNVPPDPQLAVGPNHIIAVVNVAFAIYDKSGTLLQGPVTFSSFFAGTPGCSNTSVFDPNVLYDESEDRFILGVDGDGSDYCVAATQTSNPTGSWNRYGFATNISGAFFDFPQAGVGRDAIYLGSNQFLGSFYLEGRVFAMNKSAMFSGSSLTVVSRSTGSNGSTPQPVNLHGFNQGTWPSSGPHYVMTEVFDGANHTVWSWTDPFGANIFTNEGNVNLNSATGVTAGFPIDAPQAGSSDLVQANDWRGLDAEYHDGEIWMTTTIACNPGSGTVDCIRWARIDPTGPNVIDAGVFGSNGDYRFFPDLAVNSCGDMAVGYTKSSPSIVPSIRVTGRQSGDPAGSLQPETSLKDGEVAYDSFQRPGPHRWGDYTEMTIDPDGQTFWYIGEYSKDITNFNPTKWGNFIGSFQFASCAGGNAPPSVTISSPSDGASFPAGTPVSFSGSAGDTEDGDLTSSLAWTSSLDGPIGSGGSFSAILSTGTHVITASVTDSGGLAGSD
ncbi:MAG: hypothetical protein WAO20_14070, partial [Acidobacteriota bacterium]